MLIRLDVYGGDLMSEPSDDIIICRCRDVTLKEVEDAIDEGYDSLELIKRKTRISTGTCQGRTCIQLVQRILARKTGKDVENMKIPRERTPIIPVPMKYLEKGIEKEVEVDG